MTKEEISQVAKETALCFQPQVEALIIKALRAAGVRPKKKKEAVTCSSPGCDSQAVTRGMCQNCYQKWLRQKKKAEAQTSEQTPTDVIVEQLSG